MFSLDHLIDVGDSYVNANRTLETIYVLSILQNGENFLGLDRRVTLKTNLLLR